MAQKVYRICVFAIRQKNPIKMMKEMEKEPIEYNRKR